MGCDLRSGGGSSGAVRVPALGGGSGVLRVSEGLEALGQILLLDRNDTVLENFGTSICFHLSEVSQSQTLTVALATKSVTETTSPV